MNKLTPTTFLLWITVLLTYNSTTVLSRPNTDINRKSHLSVQSNAITGVLLRCPHVPEVASDIPFTSTLDMATRLLAVRYDNEMLF